MAVAAVHTSGAQSSRIESMYLEDDTCPDYSTYVGSRLSMSTTFQMDIGSSMRHQELFRHNPNSTSRSCPNGLEKVVYTYNVRAGSAELQFLISVQPKEENTRFYTFSLSMRTGNVERALCEPINIKLSIDHRCLRFAVFIIPHKISLPAESHWNLRVWLRSNGVDHRLFADDELWVAQDPDFSSICDASFAQLERVTHDTQTYQGYVGRAPVKYIIKWQHAGESEYNLSVECDAGGVGRILFDNYRVGFACDPSTVTFVIYTVPMTSNPPGASHRIRFWLRTPAPVPVSENTSYPSFPVVSQSSIYQRLWKSDDLRLGGELDFQGLGGQMVMGMPAPGSPQIIGTEVQSPRIEKPHRSHSLRKSLLNRQHLS